MTVEKVIVKTIKRSCDRQLAVKACLLDSGVPKCLIEMFVGVDANTASREDVIATLEKEGLRFHENPQKITWTHVCSSLGFYQALTQISLSNETTMLMNDDKKLTIPFCELQELLSKLPYDAKVFQPQWYIHREDERDFPGKFPRKARFVKRDNDDLYEGYSPFLQGFMTLSDDVLILTPEGASWACEQILANSKRYKAGHCICNGESEGLYTSKNDLTAEIGGQGYWTSGHGGH